jgi:hypothetical protein
MTEEALWLDGNGLAGLLVEVFGAEMTTVPRQCQSCGNRNVVGAHRAYSGATSGPIRVARIAAGAIGGVAILLALLTGKDFDIHAVPRTA